MEKSTALAPKPGQKPAQSKKGPVTKPAAKSDEPQDAAPKKSSNGTPAKDGEPQDIPGLVRDKRGKKAGRKRQ